MNKQTLLCVILTCINYKCSNKQYLLNNVNNARRYYTIFTLIGMSWNIEIILQLSIKSAEKHLYEVFRMRQNLMLNTYGRYWGLLHASTMLTLSKYARHNTKGLKFLLRASRNSVLDVVKRSWWVDIYIHTTFSNTALSSEVDQSGYSFTYFLYHLQIVIETIISPPFCLTSASQNKMLRPFRLKYDAV